MAAAAMIGSPAAALPVHFAPDVLSWYVAEDPSSGVTLMWFTVAVGQTQPHMAAVTLASTEDAMTDAVVPDRKICITFTAL